MSERHLLIFLQLHTTSHPIPTYTYINQKMCVTGQNTSRPKTCEEQSTSSSSSVFTSTYIIENITNMKY